MLTGISTVMHTLTWDLILLLLKHENNKKSQKKTWNNVVINSIGDNHKK